MSKYEFCLEKEEKIYNQKELIALINNNSINTFYLGLLKNLSDPKQLTISRPKVKVYCSEGSSEPRYFLEFINNHDWNSFKEFLGSECEKKITLMLVLNDEKMPSYTVQKIKECDGANNILYISNSSTNITKKLNNATQLKPIKRHSDFNLQATAHHICFKFAVLQSEDFLLTIKKMRDKADCFSFTVKLRLNTNPKRDINFDNKLLLELAKCGNIKNFEKGFSIEINDDIAKKLQHQLFDVVISNGEKTYILTPSNTKPFDNSMAGAGGEYTYILEDLKSKPEGTKPDKQISVEHFFVQKTKEENLRSPSPERRRCSVM